MLRSYLSAALLLLAAEVAAVGEHEHGVGHLFLVAEGNELQVQLTLAADDLGLQGTPEQIWQQAQKLLLPPPLALQDDSDCQLLSSDFNSPYAHNNHADNADHADHADHAEATGHSDLEVSYHWQCQQPVQSLQLSLFERLPSLQVVKAQVISPSRQKAELLSPQSPDLQWH